MVKNDILDLIKIKSDKAHKLFTKAVKNKDYKAQHIALGMIKALNDLEKEVKNND